jgi:Rrf2 family protein
MNSNRIEKSLHLNLLKKYYMLSKKTRYAMVALVYLARHYGGRVILISEIAQNEKIPQRYLEAILLELKRLGILGSKLGKSGGYFLIKDPSSVYLLDIVRHFEGTIAMLACVSEKSYQPCEFCKDESKCRIRKVFKEIRDNSFNILRNTSLKDLTEEG